MPRVFTASFSGVSVSAAQDLFELTAPATAIVKLREVHITDDTSETSEQLPFTIKRIPATPTGGSGGSTPSLRKLEPGDAAAGSTVEANNTSRASSSGTIETIYRQSENMLNGFHWVATPESMIVAPPSGVLVVGLETAPSAARTMSGTLIFEEVG